MQPLSKSDGILITPGDVRYLASFIHSSGTVQERAISFGAGTAYYDLLLKVPLASAGELDPHTSIRITVGYDAPGAGVDHDPKIGITDGVNHNNIFHIVDVSNYPSLPPCFPLDATHDNKLVSGVPVPSQVTFLFEPFNKYGACYTAQNGGYVNTGTFNAQLDLSHGVSLIVQRDDPPETYRFYYFLVEILN